MPLIDLAIKEKALLVTVKLNSIRDSWKVEELSDELQRLALSSGVEIAGVMFVNRDKPAPDLYIGKGKTYEIMDKVTQEGIDTVIFNNDLSGTQQRNLEEIIDRKTIDRTQLILDIFAQHAKTLEGKIQVELAQLQYLIPRLTGKGIMLSRLGGGIGTRGPGEKKLEIDRRRIAKKITHLERQLKDLSAHRDTMRKNRVEAGMPLVSLVGYTNAGKSTLLNALTQAEQVIRNSLFTTLDPIARTLKLPNGHRIVISDTVGFLHRLPHHIIEAFKATLEEVAKSDLLVHILDVSHKKIYEHNESVYEVLKELDCEDKPVITVLNKIDKLENRSWLKHLKQDFPNSVAISAKNKENLDEFLALISGMLSNLLKPIELSIPLDKMSLVNQIYKKGRVEKIQYTKDCVILKAFLPEKAKKQILHELQTS